jgi:hypothetical protein
VTDEEDIEARVLSLNQVEEFSQVSDVLVVVANNHAFAVGAPVAPVIQRVDGVTTRQEKVDNIVVTATMLAEAMGNQKDCHGVFVRQPCLPIDLDLLQPLEIALYVFHPCPH